MTENIAANIKERLGAAQKILIVSHVRPDGDAIGSLLGLGLALENAGKIVQMVLVDGLPANFSYLEGSERIQKEPQTDFDTFITVDCADFKRVGQRFESYPAPDINIDHHITNQFFGKLNLIEGQEVATASILTRYLPAWGYEITRPVAAALLTGMITDTLGFRTSNMTPDALRRAADLMETGVDLTDIYMRSLIRRPYNAARYWGAGLSKLESANGMVWTVLSLEDRKACGYSGNDDADLINMVSAIDGHKVAMIFVEQEGGSVKLSWRALEKDIDVSIVASHFGGGGHKAAAGATISGSLEEVQDAVLKTSRKLLRL